MFICTNKEAENYGRFLRELLLELMRWYNDKTVYEKEAIGPSLPGFLKKWSSNPNETVFLQYEEFRSVMFKWHKNLTMAFRSCLDSRDYMHARNALAVLEKLAGLFPMINFHGTALEEKVALIAGKAETRGDIQIRAQGYLAILQKSSKTWVSVAKFSSQPKSAVASITSHNPTPSSTPRTLSPNPTGQTSSHIQKPISSLNPAASLFKPRADNPR
jgi:THO complex subunit 2